MKKALAILLSLLMLLSLAACGGKDAAPAASGENQKPSIQGVQDASVEAGQSFDALAGVTAADPEDGDITGMINVESTPSLDFKGGKATPENAGSYELVYSVTDKAGATAEAYATLTVTKKTGEATLLKQFDFSTADTANAHGWEAVVDGADAAGALKDGAFVVDIVNPGEGDGAIRFVKNLDVKAGADYKIKIWAKSTAPTFAHFIPKDGSTDEWKTFGGEVWNFRLDETMKCIESNFTAPEDGVAELRLHLGKITPNPENAADTTPENFSVIIDKVEIYESVGAEVLEPLYTAEFAGSGAAVAAGDGAAASVAYEDGAAVFSIDAYPGEGGGVWSIRAVLELPGITIEQGEKYNYSFTVVSENNQGGEALVESDTQEWAARANFNGIGLEAGQEVTVNKTFTAEANISDPVLRMQIGNPSEDVTANKITVKNFVFNKVGGDKETKKTIEDFAPFGMRAAENVDKEKYPWETFNGTDEDNERGVGTIWTSDGSLFYRIDDGGTVDWHNKLICPITLPADSYFTVEIKAKADKPVSCGFFLNPQGSWDPRVSEGMDFTTEEKTFTFETKDIFITDMPCELLFQFGSEATAALNGVTIEFTSVAIYQMPLL